MPAVHMPTRAIGRTFGAHPDDQGYLDMLVAGGCHAIGTTAMLESGLNWLQILQLVWKYGPMITQIASDVLAALKSTGGLTITIINTLVQTYGPQVMAMIQALLQYLGINMPT